MKTDADNVLMIPLEPELKRSIEEAARKTGISQEEIIDLALRIGTTELVKRTEARTRPRRPLTDYMDAFAGVVDRNRERVATSRLS
jgi:hypothetical protein